MTSGAIVSQVAEKTELKAKQVRAVFAELREVAYAEVAKTEKFTIPQLVMLKLKHKPARKVGTKMMFGKEVRVAAKPARQCCSWSCRAARFAEVHGAAGRPVSTGARSI